MITNPRVDLRFKLYQAATARLTQDWETGVPRLLGPGTSSSPGSTLTMFLGVAEERGDMVTSHQSPAQGPRTAAAQLPGEIWLADILTSNFYFTAAGRTGAVSPSAQNLSERCPHVGGGVTALTLLTLLIRTRIAALPH